MQETIKFCENILQLYNEYSIKTLSKIRHISFEIKYKDVKTS